jgi:S-DNA-T family DNA segregation ATPase FtsK/SpoIIIE
MRLDNPIQVDMILGDGARDRGARADHISELTLGVAYVRVEGTRELRRVRSAYLDDEAIANLAATCSPLACDPSETPTSDKEVA